MNTIETDLFAELMSLPDVTRLDLLEFLGAVRVGKQQLSQMINDIEESFQKKQSYLGNSVN